MKWLPLATRVGPSPPSRSVALFLRYFNAESPERRLELAITAEPNLSATNFLRLLVDRGQARNLKMADTRDGKSRIYRVADGVTFLGWRIFPSHTGQGPA